MQSLALTPKSPAHRANSTGELRLLHVAAGNLYGGVERMLITTAQHAMRCEGLLHEFAVCFPGRLQMELERLDAVVHELGSLRFRQPWSVLRARRALQSIVDKRGIHAVVSHGCWPLAALGWRTARPCRSVLWAHDSITGRHWVERLAVRRHIDDVIANSEWVRDTVQRWRPNVPATVICSSVDLPVEALPRSGHIREELGTPPDSTVIVQVSRMESWKGHRLLLEAARRMNEAGTNAPWEIWIVGGPQRPTEEAYLQSLHGQVANCGLQTRVRWLGQRSDVPQILADADVFCQPNAAPEPLGVVFLEALGQGLPVVSFNFGGAQEVIPAAAGILVEPGNIAALAAALRGLIDNPAERQRLQGAGTAHARRLADPLERLRDLQRALSPSSSRDVRFHGHR